MKLTAGLAYRVTSVRYASSEPASVSLASSASLGATDTRYTRPCESGFQDFARGRRYEIRGVVGRFVRYRQAVEIPLGVNRGHAAGTCRRHRLAIDVILDVTGRENTRATRFRSVMRADVTCLVELDLAAEERRV